MEDQEIVQRINSFPYWIYPFDLRGHKTPVLKNSDTYVHFENRPFKRKKHILDPVIKLCGGSLKGKRVSARASAKRTSNILVVYEA